MAPLLSLLLSVAPGHSKSPGRVERRGALTCCFCLNTERARRDSNP